MMRRGRLNITAVAAVCAVAALGVAGCGDTKEPESVQRVVVPKVDVKTLKAGDIKPVPQAEKFKGAQKEVASDIDRIVVAINADDAAYMCSNGYTKEDLKVLNAGGACAKTVLTFLSAYAGYRLDIEQIKVQGDTAKVDTRVITAFKKEKKPITQSIPMKFLKQNGHWRMSLDLQQKLDQAPPSSSVGTVQDDPSTPEDESTAPAK